MALLGQQFHRSMLTRADWSTSNRTTAVSKRSAVVKGELRRTRCSAIAIDSPTPLAGGFAGIRWGSVKLQGVREEMEDDVVVAQPETLDGFSFAAVFDGHGGVSAVKFLRDELYKECVSALHANQLLISKDLNAIKGSLKEAFANVDARLLNQLEVNGDEDESGATATAVFIRKDMLLIAHIGDSSVVISRSGKPEILTSPHRPYGSNTASLQEIRRIREAGGWIVNGRICGDIAVSRAFGDIRFKTKKNEMLKKGLEEGRWSEKFISRVRFNGDLVTACPDISEVALGSDAEFVIIASDGVWDYMSSSEVVSFVRNQLRQHGNVQLACDSLAQMALDRRSQDNISIVIADLGFTDWQNLPEERQNILYELGQAVATVSIVSLGIWIFSILSVQN